MAFQRSYSKVWWASDNDQFGGTANSLTSGGFYTHYSQPQPSSLDAHVGHKGYAGNLSCIQEADDEQNCSKLSWHKHDSPSSLRSQDSGFSDNEQSHSARTPPAEIAAVPGDSIDETPSNGNSNSGTPTSVRSVATPPTVIRRVGNSSFYSPLVNVTRRISFSSRTDLAASVSADADADEDEDADVEEGRSKLFEQFDSMQLALEDTPQKKHRKQRQLKFDETATGCVPSATPPRPARRGKRVVRKATQPLSPSQRRRFSRQELEEDDDDEPPPPYNNETVYLGEAPPPYNNETVLLGSHSPSGDRDADDTLTSKFDLSPVRNGVPRYTASTSTPNAKTLAHTRLIYEEAPSSPPLSVNLPSVQSWLSSARWQCEQEVMCTLQTKSIAQEAYKNFTITTNSVAKLIRQLQQQALTLQTEFERNERLLSEGAGLSEALVSAQQLLAHLNDFTRVLERRAIFFNESRSERRRYEQQLEQIRTISKDTSYSLERQHYITLASLLDDVQLLKRSTVITLRLIFHRLVYFIVVSIEQSRCDLLLRANINMVATLMNIDYAGFASLTDAFVQNEAVRTLLLIVLDHKISSVRALALRALATLCCAPEAIAQLGSCDGIEIVKDILQTGAGCDNRSLIERREAVSLLVQITAAWHGEEHRVSGLKDCADALVEGLAALLTPSCCPQTLLLCAAALNNLSRMEVTSHYSVMSHEAIFKLIATLEHQQNFDTGVFLYDQIVSMLHNMSLNKKCHSHLANGIIVNFITSVYQSEFYKTYSSRAECEAQRRTIKAILHTLTRLAQDSQTLAASLVEQWQLPGLMATATASVSALDNSNIQSHSQSHSHGRDISQLARQLLHAHRQEQLLLQATTYSTGHQTPEAQTSSSGSAANGAAADCAAATKAARTAAPTSGLKFNLTRQESFV